MCGPHAPKQSFYGDTQNIEMNFTPNICFSNTFFLLYHSNWEIYLIVFIVRFVSLGQYMNLGKRFVNYSMDRWVN